MQKKQLGNSDLHISPIGVGAWAIGGADWAFGWSHQEDKDSIKAIHAALDAGINWIDTAAVYGLGHSEQVVSQALKEWKGPRPYVFTKCERAWNEKRQIVKSLKADSIRRECEDSLRRLQTDVIDLYQIHWPEPIEDIAEGWSTLVDLQREGKVRWIGLSNFNVEQMLRVQSLGAITSLQPPYSLIRPEVESEVLPFTLANHIGVIAYSPMGSGMLTGKMSRERVAKLPQDDWRRQNAHFQEPLLSRNLKIADKVNEIAERCAVHPGVVAIGYVLRNPAVTGAIVGLRNAEQVAELSPALEFHLDDDHYHALKSL